MLTTITSAVIDGLTTSGALLVTAPNGDGYRIEVDERSLLRLHQIIEMHFNLQSCSIRTKLQEQVLK